jgi:hypothetical protein
MSKFVDKLQSLSKASTSPIGFRSAVSEAKSSAMLLIAGLSQVDLREAEVLAKNKVEAVLIPSQSIEGVKQMVKVMGDIPLGILVKDTNKEEMDKLVDCCDFVVFDVKMPLVELCRQELGKFLMIEPSLDPGLIRAINRLDVDGVFIDRGEESFITVERLLIYHRFSELLDKPLVVTLPSLVTSAELSNLWQAGMDGIVIPPAQPKEAFTKLRRMIDNLPREAKHRRRKAGVILPHYGGGMDIESEEEEI